MFRKSLKRKDTQAQTAIEYLLLTTVIAVVVFLGMDRWLRETREGSDVYFNEVVTNLVGPPPPADLSPLGR